jgi:polar amino acid transport system permease protein
VALADWAWRSPAPRRRLGNATSPRGYIQLFQGTPLLMQLFLVFFGCTVLGAGIDPLAAAAIALTLNAAAFLGEIWRGCIQAVPVGQ